MGQHKDKDRKPYPHKFILCTKWAIEQMREKETDASTYKSFWTPVGTQGKIPVSFDTEQAALDRLKDIIIKEPKIAKQNLKFAVLEVRYVPNVVKVYNQAWFEKYVSKETPLELQEHKFIDKLQ